LSLARSAQGGALLPDGSGDLDHLGYYFMSTAFLLSMPTTILTLLQRRLTIVDLLLEPRIRTQYELQKLLNLSYTADWELARCHPQLEYDPDKADPGRPGRDQLLSEAPQVYARQGLYRGNVGMISDALIRSRGQRIGPKTLGEFQAEWDATDSPVYAVRNHLVELFFGFHPERKPVLWRVLIAQYLLHKTILSGATELPSLSTAEESQLRWRDDDETDASISAAQIYVRGKLIQLVERMERHGESHA
jgi:hypothetical protein